MNPGPAWHVVTRAQGVSNSCSFAMPMLEGSIGSRNTLRALSRVYHCVLCSSGWVRALSPARTPHRPPTHTRSHSYLASTSEKHIPGFQSPS